ncbi:MAG: hypothetical protein ACREEM_40195, partial [Blastocatellia bacterium]
MIYRCHDLASWSFTLVATRSGDSASDATTLRRGVSRWLLPQRRLIYRCHDLASVSFTLIATAAAIDLPMP